MSSELWNYEVSGVSKDFISTVTDKVLDDVRACTRGIGTFGPSCR